MYALTYTLIKPLLATEVQQLFAVVVTLTLKAGLHERFMPLMWANAKASLAEEAGCHQFDIATDPARPAEVFLYEVYEDRAAFEAHLGSTHFQTFDQATKDMIEEKQVKTYSEVTQ